MLLRSMFFVCIAIGLISCQRDTPAQVSEDDLQKEAIAIVQQFASSLKPQLKKALQTGGPAHAVAVCAKTAPLLAAQLSQETGWAIKRVSLKARNHKTAIPDMWETSVLNDFDRQQAAGETASAMTASLIEENTYRFMKAQLVEPVCLTCHGQNISTDVLDALNKHYPQDQARQYTLGQVRGAFSLSKGL